MELTENLQVERIKEEDDIFSFVVVEADLLELTVDNGNTLELRSDFLNFGNRHFGFKH